MKKKLLTLFLLIAVAVSAVCGFTAFADVSMEECDRCFQTTVNSFLESYEVDGNSITAVRKAVYDLNLQHLGYEYEFEIIGGSGYAIIICDDGNYIAQEFVPHSQSPYAELEEDELCVYVNSMTYLKYNGTAICDIETSEEVPADVLDALAENAIYYQLVIPSGVASEVVTINYNSRVVESNVLSKSIPRYANASGLESSCAAIAGMNIIGFYDRYYDDLIGDFTAGVEMYGYYLYALSNEKVYDCMRELYADMNGTAAGISETNFKNGMIKYCANRNLTCEFTQLVSSGKLNFDGVKQSINENKPVALLLSNFTVGDYSGGGGTDNFTYLKYSGNHVMAGFGYCDINYILTSGSTANCKFVYVASGFLNPLEGYFNIAYSTNINSAYKVYIH